MKKLILPLLTCLVLCGCTDLRDIPPDRIKDNVAAPDGAKNFKVLGGEWYSFEMDDHGKTTKILMYDSGVADRRTVAMTKIN